MSKKRTAVIVAGIMLSLFMASMEATVIATAMPTIVGQLGGLEIYSWVFSMYMLASTTTTPLYGKLSDLYGRLPIYVLAMVLFLLGSILCGMAQSMGQLVAFRAIQGLGAGGVMPMSFIIVGDLFDFKQRARMQGFFSGVWGVSSVIGPLLGGFLVDKVSWHWVFFVNVIPGIIAMLLVWLAWQEPVREDTYKDGRKVSVDYAGAILMSVTIVCLLIGLAELETTLGKGLLVIAIVLAVILYWVERRATDPIVPLPLLNQRLFVVACLHGLLSGWAMFGSLSFIPLFVQAALGASATAAGSTLTPMLLGWVAASIIGSRLLLRMSYRTLALIGMVLLTIGGFLLAQAGSNSTQVTLMIALLLMGVGMGCSIPAFMLAVQSTVPRRQLGTATSSLAFTRSIGGTLGVSVMGIYLAHRLSAGLVAAGLDPTTVSVDKLLDPLARSNGGVALQETIQPILANAIGGIFVIALVGSVLGLLATTLAPGGQIDQSERPGQGESPKQTETASSAVAH